MNTIPEFVIGNSVYIECKIKNSSNELSNGLIGKIVGINDNWITLSNCQKVIIHENNFENYGRPVPGSTGIYSLLINSIEIIIKLKKI